uniref:Uncharacterized protein n=1 Tax=Rhizophora mucronata TaxID=61149 RepID=A0A2P2QUS2_RHIMU
MEINNVELSCLTMPIGSLIGHIMTTCERVVYWVTVICEQFKLLACSFAKNKANPTIDD